MIIIIDEASAKLASFYYHGEIFRPEWRNASNMASVSGEQQDEFQEKLQEKLPDELWEEMYVALASAESINGSQKTTTKEYADKAVKTNIENIRIPESLTNYIWIVSSKQQK